VLSDADLLAAHRLELPWGFAVPQGDPTPPVGWPHSPQKVMPA
jgi:hypothetical protein